MDTLIAFAVLVGLMQQPGRPAAPPASDPPAADCTRDCLPKLPSGSLPGKMPRKVNRDPPMLGY
jgi:hypothetical protein